MSRIRTASPWALAASAYAVLVALSLSYFIARIPLQVNDCLSNMLTVQMVDFWPMMRSQFNSEAYLRPFLWAQIDLSFELAHGHYLAMYKSIHAAQLVATALLFVNLLRVRTLVAALAVPFGVAILFGGHTFAGTVVEGFPINTFLTIVVCCLLGANLSFGPPALWRDIAAIALFLFAVLTVETGVLVLVGLVAAWLVGARGVSRSAVLVATAALFGYLYMRFGPLHVGTPDLLERSSGYGFRVLETDELVARFGAWPYGFYAYNVASQLATVLFSEPSGGVWKFVDKALGEGASLSQIIAVTTRAATTLMIIWYAFARRHDWRHGRLTHGDRLLAVFVAVYGANAMVSYPYTKNVIMSPAGAFYAVAAVVAFTEILSRIGRVPLRPAALAMSLILTVVSAGWAIQLIGIHYNLREKAFVIRNDWMTIYNERRPKVVDIDTNPQAAALVRQLYDQALSMPTVAPHIANSSIARYFESSW